MGVTIRGMATRKNRPSTGSAKIDRVRVGRNINVWINPVLGALFDEQLKESRRTLTAEIEVALEHYLASLGKWPPKARG